MRRSIGEPYVGKRFDQWTTWSGEVKRVADEDVWQINAGHVRMVTAHRV